MTRNPPSRIAQGAFLELYLFFTVAPFARFSGLDVASSPVAPPMLSSRLFDMDLCAALGLA